jgi:seryl-tRNA synthetase
MAKEHGGWVESMAEERVVLRVPDDQLDAMLDELPKLGEVAQRRVNAVDMGEAHRDLRLRIDGLRRTRDRYLALLDRAQSVSDAAAVEKEIERVTAQLEQLEAQLAAMEKRIQFSSLAVGFSRKLRPGPVGWVFYALYSGMKWLLVWD